MKNKSIVEKIISENFIRNMFERTKDGKLVITVYPPDRENAYDVTCDVDWAESNADELTEKYNSLITALTRIGQLEDENKNWSDLLTTEEYSVFNTFIRPFEPFEDMAKVTELFLAEDEALSEEELALKRRFFEWRKAQSLKRLPQTNRSPENFIVRARRYEMLINCDAPEIIIKDEARCLAEEMVLYYCGK